MKGIKYNATTKKLEVVEDKQPFPKEYEEERLRLEQKQQEKQAKLNALKQKLSLTDEEWELLRT